METTITITNHYLETIIIIIAEIHYLEITIITIITIMEILYSEAVATKVYLETTIIITTVEIPYLETTTIIMEIHCLEIKVPKKF